MDRKRVMISSHLRDDDPKKYKKNMEKASILEKIFSSTDTKAIAVHAHVPFFLDDTVLKESKVAEKISLLVLEICDELLVCGDWISSGMAMEIEFAKKHDIPIVYKTTLEIEKLIQAYKE